MDVVVERALGLAIQILEELPDEARPGSDIADMRRMLEGRDSGRDNYIIIEALTTVLALRASEAMTNPIQMTAGLSSNESKVEAITVGMTNRMNELADLFDGLSKFNGSAVGLHFLEACKNVRILNRQGAGGTER
jgi:hypothetical protein